MGVLNKLKGRMSGPRKTGEVYGFSTGKERGSGVNAVGMGLAAGQGQAPIESNVGAEIAETMAGIGESIGAGIVAASDGKNLRKESITKSKKDGKTGKEARDIWKKERADKKAKRKRDKEAEKAGIDTSVKFEPSDDASQYNNNIYNA